MIDRTLLHTLWQCSDPLSSLEKCLIYWRYSLVSKVIGSNLEMKPIAFFKNRDKDSKGNTYQNVFHLTGQINIIERFPYEYHLTFFYIFYALLKRNLTKHCVQC